MTETDQYRTQEAYRSHYEMWDWLSKHPGKDKKDWFVETGAKMFNGYDNCFLCKNTLGCKTCPLYQVGQWCGLERSWFQTWFDNRTRQDIARKIRDVVLPYLDKLIGENQMTETDKYQMEPITSSERSILLDGLARVFGMYETLASDALFQEKKREWLKLQNKVIGAEKILKF